MLQSCSVSCYNTMKSLITPADEKLICYCALSTKGLWEDAFLPASVYVRLHKPGFFQPSFMLLERKRKSSEASLPPPPFPPFFWSQSERFREQRRAHCSNGAVCNYPRAIVSLWKAHVQVLELRLQETNDRRAKGVNMWVSEAACLGNVHSGTFSLRKSPVCSWFSDNQ